MAASPPPAGRRVPPWAHATWPWIAGAAVAGALALAASLLPDQPAPVPIAADLTHAGSARVVFEKPLASTTSPTCGCLRSEGHRPPGGWQGIVVPARQMTLTRSGDAYPTRFDVSNAEPATWAEWPTYLGLEVRVSIALVPSGHRPRLREMLAPTLLRSPERIVADLVSIRTRGPLHVASFGDEPIAAIGVQRGAVTQIDYRTPVARPDDRTLRVSAPFADTWSPTTPVTEEGPLIDVLGPSLLMWAPLAGRLAYTQAVLIQPPVGLPPGRSSPAGADGRYETQDTIVEHLRSPGGLTPYVVLAVRRGAYAVRILPRPAPGRPSLASDATWDTRSRLVVQVPHVVSQADALIPSFRRAAARPRVDVTDIPFIMPADLIPGKRSVDMPEGRLWYRDWLPFDRPPTPPVSGINVFGEIADLRLRDVRGHVTAGARPLSLAGRSDLELRHIAGHGVDRDHLLIPVRLDAGTAQIYVKGEADARLNGIPLATRRHWLVQALAGDTMMLIATIAGALLTGAALLRGRRARESR